MPCPLQVVIAAFHMSFPLSRSGGRATHCLVMPKPNSQLCHTVESRSRVEFLCSTTNLETFLKADSKQGGWFARYFVSSAPASSLFSWMYATAACTSAEQRASPLYRGSNRLQQRRHQHDIAAHELKPQLDTRGEWRLLNLARFRKHFLAGTCRFEPCSVLHSPGTVLQVGQLRPS